MTRRPSRPAGASTLTQQLARNLFPEPSASGSATSASSGRSRRRSSRSRSRSATRSARSSPSTQPDALRPRHLRRRGGGAPVLRQVGQGSVARGGGAARRHLPVAGAPEPVRQHGRARRAAATTCCSGWPTRATSRRPRPTPPREADRRRAASRSSRRSMAPFFLEEVRKHLERAVRREGAVRERADGDDDARSGAAGGREPRRRARAAAPRQAARLSARRQRNVLAEGHTIEAFKDERWTRPIARRRHRAGRRRVARQAGAGRRRAAARSAATTPT